MHPYYEQWLKNRRYSNQYFIDINRFEKEYGDLEAHFKNETYQSIIEDFTYSKADERAQKPNPSKIIPKKELKNGLASFISSYKTPLNNYLIFLQEQNIKTYDGYLKNLNAGIANSLNDNPKARAKRLEKASPKPNKRTVTITVYDRNPDVVAKILLRANGICESCKNPAPFIRRKNNTPFLEVHHIKQLASGGDDTVENAQALCPNCHREKHHG